MKEFTIGFYLRNNSFLKIYREIIEVFSNSGEKVLITVGDQDLEISLRQCTWINLANTSIETTEKYNHIESLSRCKMIILQEFLIDDIKLNYLKEHKTTVILSGLHWLDSLVFPPSKQNRFSKLLLPSRKIFDFHSDIINCLSQEKYDQENRNLEQLESKISIVGSPMFDGWLNLLSNTNKSRKKVVLFTRSANEPNGRNISKAIFSAWPNYISKLYALLMNEKEALNLIKSGFSIDNLIKELLLFCEENSLELVVKQRAKNTGAWSEVIAKYGLHYVEEPKALIDYRDWMKEFLVDCKISISFKSFSLIDAVLAGSEAININIPIFDHDDFIKIPKSNPHLGEYYYYFLDKMIDSSDSGIMDYSNIINLVNYSDLKTYLNHNTVTDKEKTIKYFDDAWGLKLAPSYTAANKIMNRLLG